MNLGWDGMGEERKIRYSCDNGAEEALQFCNVLIRHVLPLY